TGTTARVLTPNGADTEMRAVRTAGRTDSLVLRLRRIGYEGFLALDAIGDARGGLMRSNPATSNLESVVVTGTAQRALARADTRIPQPAASPPAAAKRDEAPARERDAAAATKIIAHVVSCTTRR
ncbi:MAG: hypothetical protein JWL61_1446, partial [Gemmatimonadetes bacterium]|nr:hypothetical protein [Gemmatimonadota bacterium]